MALRGLNLFSESFREILRRDKKDLVEPESVLSCESGEPFNDR